MNEWDIMQVDYITTRGVVHGEKHEGWRHDISRLYYYMWCSEWKKT